MAIKNPTQWKPRDGGSIAPTNIGVARLQENGVARLQQDSTARVLEDNVVTQRQATVWTES